MLKRHLLFQQLLREFFWSKKINELVFGNRMKMRKIVRPYTDVARQSGRRWEMLVRMRFSLDWWRFETVRTFKRSKSSAESWHQFGHVNVTNRYFRLFLHLIKVYFNRSYLFKKGLFIRYLKFISRNDRKIGNIMWNNKAHSSIINLFPNLSALIACNAIIWPGG